VQLHRAREEFDVAGANLVLIGQATPRQAAHFRRRMKIDLPVLADEQRVSYKAIGAKKGSVGELVGPRMLARGVAASAKNRVVQGRTIGSATQLGGAMVVAAGGRIAWSHLASDASDNASPEEILAAVRKVA
jgi:prostamide/prostaglandin F2alpha synthase